MVVKGVEKILGYIFIFVLFSLVTKCQISIEIVLSISVQSYRMAFK
jgi:hypothetical protein